MFLTRFTILSGGSRPISLIVRPSVPGVMLPAFDLMFLYARTMFCSDNIMSFRVENVFPALLAAYNWS